MKFRDWPFGEQYPASNGAVLAGLLILGWCAVMAAVVSVIH